MRRSPALWLAVAMVVGCVGKTPPAADEVDRYITETMKAQKLPAISVLVMKDGNVIKQHAYGQAKLEPSTPASDDTVFPIFSITKTFTAVGVLRLVDEGKLSLDDTVGQRLPDQPEAWRPITVRQLLSHTSGLPDLFESSDPNYLSENRDEALRLIASKPLVAKPGESSAYLQTGYVLLAMMIEKTTGKPFTKYMQDDIFAPLGMMSTTFGNRAANVPGRAAQYQNVKFERMNGEWHTRKLGAPVLSDLVVHPSYNDVGANLNTTTSDLIKWELALTSGKLLKPDTLAAMWKPSKTSIRLVRNGTAGMGLAWYVYDLGGHRTAAHGGGGSSLYLRLLDDHITIVVLTNCHGAEVDQIAEFLTSHYFPELTKSSPFAKQPNKQ